MTSLTGSSASNDDDDGIGRLRVGVALTPSDAGGVEVADPASPAHAHLEAFARAAASVAGCTVEVEEFIDYAGLLEAIRDGEIHLAWLPPLVAMRTASQGTMLPVAIPVRSGAAFFWSALFAHHRSGIMTPQDLKGARAAWVHPQSASGFLVIRAWLRSQNVDLRAAFSEESFLGSHADVVEAVLTNQADVGATYVHLEPDGGRRVVSAGWGDEPVRIVGLAGPIPADVIAASIRLPAKLIRRLRDALVKDPQGELSSSCAALLGAESFLAAESDHLAPLMKLLDHLDGLGRRPFSVFPKGSAY